MAIAESLPQGTRLGKSFRPGRSLCVGCSEPRTLYIPYSHLTYEEKINYEGPMLCSDCAPRFNELPTRDLGTVL
jgi:hypothetical protein